MRHEDHDGANVEPSPESILEQLELQRIDVAYRNWHDGRVIRPEKSERGNTMTTRRFSKQINKLMFLGLCGGGERSKQCYTSH